MSRSDPSHPHRLYELLPRIYRIRDAEQGWPLRALLEVIGEQVDLVDENLTQLYENWFIETAEPWAIPYLGELVGVEPPPEAPGASAARAEARTRVLAPRRAIARALRHRRRKGTLAALQGAAGDATRWAVHAVELCERVGRTLGVRTRAADPELGLIAERVEGGWVDLRDESSLAREGGAFDRLAHTVDVRSIESRLSQGLASPLGVGLFVWRLRAFPLTRAPARCVERVAPDCFSFHVLGQDAPIFVRPEPGAADERGVPGPLAPHVLAEDPASFVGPGRSFDIRKGGPCGPSVRAQDVTAADLDAWAEPPPGRVFVDPRLGRFAFAPGEAPEQGAWVSCHTGFAMPIGGGEYPRPVPTPADARLSSPGSASPKEEAAARPVLYRVSRRWHLCPEERDGDEPEPFRTLGEAFDRWRAEAPRQAIVEIADSSEYVEALAIEAGDGQHVTLRAAQGARPLLRLLDLRTPAPDPLVIRGQAGEGEAAPTVVLDGLWLAGRFVRVSGRLDALVIRHCTLVPGWDLRETCEPEEPGEPSLRIDACLGRLTLCQTITGPIVVRPAETCADTCVELVDSILDAGERARHGDQAGFERSVLARDTRSGRAAPVLLDATRCTVLGRVDVAALSLAQDVLFAGRLRVQERQRGCVRFCYLAPGSETPPRFHCQPRSDAPLVRPAFASIRFGTPEYARLAAATPEEIRRGAESGSEMGVYHDLFEPQRLDLLRRRLAEFTPARAESGAVFLT